jgi:hypothetical protein
MNLRVQIAIFILISLILSSCGPKIGSAATPPVDTAGTAVAAALTAIPPQPTYTPYPTATPYPTLDLAGLFCEYEFCIGHPVRFPFFDLEVVNDYTANRSSYDQGAMIGFDGSLYIFLSWSRLVGEFDPSAMLAAALLTDPAQETRLTEDISGRAVTYTLLQSTASQQLPFGLAAAWRCGDRQFGWKIYAPADGQALEYLWEAVSRFTCSNG